uniref:hypothetical protein n=1 Tax=Dyadobacter sp. OTU695 TaxID=3043860 RepID=UPI00313ED071
MGIKAVEMIATSPPGAPLCRAFAPGSPSGGVEVNFKGGQVGGEDSSEVVKEANFEGQFDIFEKNRSYDNTRTRIHIAKRANFRRVRDQ